MSVHFLVERPDGLPSIYQSLAQHRKTRGAIPMFRFLRHQKRGQTRNQCHQAEQITPSKNENAGTDEIWPAYALCRFFS